MSEEEVKSKLVKMPESLFDAITREAALADMDGSAFIRTACRELIERRKQDRAAAQAMRRMQKAGQE